MTDRAGTGLFLRIATALCLLFCAVVTSRVAAHANQNGVTDQQDRAFVSGHVYRADNAAPMAGAVVALSPCYVAGVMWEQKATTAADGSYTVTARPFCYFAAASASGFVRQEYVPTGARTTPVFDLKTGDRVEDIDFRLAVAATISGSVSGANGQPVPKIPVSAMQLHFYPSGESHLSSVQSVMTDARRSTRTGISIFRTLFSTSRLLRSSTGRKKPI